MEAVTSERERSLFDGVRSLSRRRGPISSRLAAAEHAVEGSRQRHSTIVLQTVRENPDRTAMEIAELCGLSEYQVRRRLTDLKNAGQITRSELARRCTIRGSLMCTWRKMTNQPE